MRALLRVFFFFYTIVLSLLLISEADTVLFEFFSMQLRTSITWFLLHSSMTSFSLIPVISNIVYYLLILAKMNNS